MTIQDAIEVLERHINQDVCFSCEYSRIEKINDYQYKAACGKEVPCAYKEAISVLKKYYFGGKRIMKNELNIIRNTLEQMVADAEDKGKETFGITLSVKDCLLILENLK